MVNAHACVMGYEDPSTGLPTQGLMMIASDDPTLFEEMRRRRCPGKEEHPSHATDIGADINDLPRVGANVVHAIWESRVGLGRPSLPHRRSERSHRKRKTS